MSEITVNIEALRDAAREVGAVADAVRSAEVSQDAGAIAAGLPGSASATAARELGAAWATRVTSIGALAETLEQNFETCADEYVAADERTAERLRSIGSRIGSPAAPNATCVAPPPFEPLEAPDLPFAAPSPFGTPPSPFGTPETPNLTFAPPSAN